MTHLNKSLYNIILGLICFSSILGSLRSLAHLSDIKLYPLLSPPASFSLHSPTIYQDKIALKSGAPSLKQIVGKNGGHGCSTELIYRSFSLIQILSRPTSIAVSFLTSGTPFLPLNSTFLANSFQKWLCTS